MSGQSIQRISGQLFDEVCITLCFAQHVKGPTRSAYLLDFVLSNFASGVRCKVVHGIHEYDHNAVLTTLDISVVESELVKRNVYDGYGFRPLISTTFSKRIGAQASCSGHGGLPSAPRRMLNCISVFLPPLCREKPVTSSIACRYRRAVGGA